MPRCQAAQHPQRPGPGACAATPSCCSARCTTNAVQQRLRAGLAAGFDAERCDPSAGFVAR